MYKIFLTFLTTIMLTANVSQRSIVPVQAVIDHIENKKGKIYLGVYSSSEDYMDTEKAIVKKIVSVEKQQSVTIDLGDLPPGKYAVVVFLDTNNNGVLDTNVFGIPKEKYGFSGTIKPMFRAPNFEEAAVSISETKKTIAVRLN
ncbi:DUF2141 domain-containing protein [Gynurincola endophyticus]|uniref:DUF2141 domain-containing protein n=1 Tax=Gynurincola endophyticus TaxID=2479004 RepID=UPI0018F49558|nr:DUF2141 domain-containing protein [Gynurincola endophyticus]